MAKVIGNLQDTFNETTELFRLEPVEEATP
jgi:hypothetical protein